MKSFFRYIILIIFLGITPLLYAGMGGGGGGGGNGMGPPCGVGGHPPCPEPIPIDGGILLLAGAGIYLGARKSLKKKKL